MDFREFSMGYGLWDGERDEWLRKGGEGATVRGYETTGEKVAAIRIK